jgi:hypothetical protein
MFDRFRKRVHAGYDNSDGTGKRENGEKEGKSKVKEEEANRGRG